MARYYNGILGPFRGKVGTVVGYLWNGKPCMRAYKRIVKNPRTEAQQAHRAMFKEEVQLAAKMRWAVKTTMTEAAREAGMTAYNLFVKVNQHAFGTHPSVSAAGGATSPSLGEELADAVLAVDYSNLILSMGDIPQVEMREMEWTADNVLTVRFGQGRGSSYDHVFLYVYVPTLETGFLSAPTYRRDKRIALALPDEYAGHEAVVYLMVQNGNGLWSDSLFCGEMALNEVVGEEENVLLDSIEGGRLTEVEGGARVDEVDPHPALKGTPPLREGMAGAGG